MPRTLTSVFRQVPFVHQTTVHGQRISAVGAQISNHYSDTNRNANPNRDPDPSPNLTVTVITLTLTLTLNNTLLTLLPTLGWLGSRVVSVLDSGAERPGFKSQSRRCRVTVVGKLFLRVAGATWRKVRAAYRRVYDSCHLQADCQEPVSAPEPYSLQSSTCYIFTNRVDGTRCELA